MKPQWELITPMWSLSHMVICISWLLPQEKIYSQKGQGPGDVIGRMFTRFATQVSIIKKEKE
jgi:hypothetical protein